MHELSVTESILNIAKNHAVKANAKQVTDIHIVIGALSSIVDDSIQFYWDIITQDTICASAELHFKRVPAKLTCQDCNHSLQYREMSCPPAPNAAVSASKWLAVKNFGWKVLKLNDKE